MSDNVDPRAMRAARRLQAWLQREKGVVIDTFDLDRIASAIAADTGIRDLEVRVMNARADLARVIDNLLDDPEE